jgi:hypothetical protein
MRGELGFPFVVARQRRHPRRWALVLTIFGYGQRRHAGMYGTTAQIANATRVAAIGAAFFSIEAARSARLALFAATALFALSIATCAVFLAWMRRAPN